MASIHDILRQTCSARARFLPMEAIPLLGGAWNVCTLGGSRQRATGPGQRPPHCDTFVTRAVRPPARPLYLLEDLPHARRRPRPDRRRLGLCPRPRHARHPQSRDPGPLGVVSDAGPDDVAAAVDAAARAQPAWWRVPGVEKARAAAHGGGEDPGRRAGALDPHGARDREAAHRGRGLHRVGRRLLRLLRRGGPAELRHLDPAGGPAPAQLHHQGAVRRRGGDRAVQLPAAAHGVEGGPGAGRGNTRGLQAAAPEPALEPAPRPVLRRAAARRGQRHHRRRRDRRGLVRHPRVDLIAFTGSVAAGRRIAAQARPGAEEGESRAGQRRPVHRVRGRRSRRRGARRRLGAAAQRGTGLHLAEARSTWSSRSPRSSPAAWRPTSRRSAWATRWSRHVDIGPLISADALDEVEAQIARAVEEGAHAPARRLPRPSPAACGATSSSRRSWPACATGRCRRPRRSSARSSRSPSRATPTRRSRMANDSRYGLGASIYTNNLEYGHAGDGGHQGGDVLDQRPADRQRRRARSAACARAGSGASSARRGSTPSASRSTCTSTT